MPLAMGLHREPPSLERLENLPLRRGPELSLDNLDMEGEHPEAASLGNPGVEQLECACCRVARVRVERLPSFLLLPVQPLKGLAGHVNLAAHLH